jgi:hypothetical protein
MSHETETFSQMIGTTMVSCVSTEDTIVFTDTVGNQHEFYHTQECCESVTIEDICGDLDDLVGSPILVAEAYTSNRSPEGQYDLSIPESGCETWTFYTYRTTKGTVTVRWYGNSNGYYSESVDYRFRKAA